MGIHILALLSESYIWKKSFRREYAKLNSELSYSEKSYLSFFRKKVIQGDQVAQGNQVKRRLIVIQGEFI